MSEATTPANTTDQIAAVVATPAVVQDAQRYDRRKDPRANGALAALTAYRKERGL